MHVTRVKALFWSGLAIAIFLGFTAFSRAFDPTVSLGLVVVAGVLVLFTSLWYRRSIKVAEQREFEARQEQLASLQKQIGLVGDQLAVKASTGLLMLALFAVVTVVLASRALAAPSARLIAGALLMAALTGLAGCAVIPFVGRPRLIVRRDGLESPVLGPVRWDQIESIALREIRYRGLVVAHALDLLIPATEEVERGMSWMRRMLRRIVLRSAPPFVVVNLKSPSIPAETLHALCSSLWSRVTGRKNPEWNVWMREHVPEFRRLEHQLATIERAGELAKSDLDAATRMLEDASREMPLPRSGNGIRHQFDR